MESTILDKDYSEISQEEIISRVKSIREGHTIIIRNFPDIDTLKELDGKIEKVLSIKINYLRKRYWITKTYEIHRFDRYWG